MDQYTVEESTQWGKGRMRHEREMFAVMNGQLILAECPGQGSLRPEFYGFLRALHTHGSLDGDGVSSVKRCLDGAKTLAECAASCVPRGRDCQPSEPPTRGAAAAAPRRRKARGSGKPAAKRGVGGRGR